MAAVLHVSGLVVTHVDLVVLGVWMLLVLPAASLVSRIRQEWRDAASAAMHLLDVLMLSILHAYSDALWWFGPTMFVFVVLLANQSLTRFWANIVTLITAGAYVALIMHQADAILEAIPLPRFQQFESGDLVIALAAFGSLALLLTAQRQQMLVRSLRRSEERVRLMLDSATDLISTVDTEGRFLSLNRAALDSTGYDAAELIGAPVEHVLHPGDSDRVRDEFRRTIGGERRSFEGRYLHRSGEVRWMACTSSPILYEERIVGALVIARDTTERRVAEQELRASESRYRHLVDTAFEGIWTIDPEGRTIHANQRMADMLGVVMDDLVGSPFFRFVPIDYISRAEECLRRRARGERDLFEFPFQRPDGTRIWTLISTSPIMDEGDRYSGAIAMVTDITAWRDAQSEREELQHELAQSQKERAVGQLVSGVAHELNNPLAAILSFTEDLLCDERSPEDREALGIVREQARRARAIVRDLLAVVRRREGRQRERCSPAELIEGVARVQRPACEAFGVTLFTAAEPGLPELDLDRAGIEQVLTNLVLNALQATGSGGRVWLRASQDGGAVRFVVEDDGPGIADEVLPRLFEPFFTTKPAGEGTGLGLPVSLGIVEQHGGTLVGGNRPAREGSGARFVIVLPTTGAGLRATRQQIARSQELGGAPRRESTVSATPLFVASVAAAHPPQGDVQGESGPAHVLVVDDESAIRAALRRYFGRRGWRVSEASDGNEALQFLRHHGGSVDVIVCDLRMPGCSGVELYNTLQATDPALLERFIFSTGDIVSPDASSFLARTESPVLEKPFELTLLEQTAGEVLERRRRAAA